MQRRDVLRVLAGLPLVALVGEAAAAEEVDSRPLWIRRGEQMCLNLNRLCTAKGWKLQEQEEILTKAICYRFCQHLDDWSISEPFAKHDPELCPNPPIPFEITPEQGQVRKAHAVVNLGVFDDLRAFHGIDAEAELVAMTGMQVALEVQMEVRRAPRPFRSYRIHTLMLTPSSVRPEDLTLRKIVRLYYKTES